MAALLVCMHSGAVLIRRRILPHRFGAACRTETVQRTAAEHGTLRNSTTASSTKQMIQLMQRSDQVALMLYAEAGLLTFDMTYCMP